MRFPADPAKFKYVRDYQTIQLTGPISVGQGQTGTFAFNFPFRFIACELVAGIFTQDNIGDPITERQYSPLDQPPILTSLKIHQSLLDNQPIPVRSAWGTAKNPAVLPIPFAIEQGWNVSLDALLMDSGIAGECGVKMDFCIRGYQPSDEEFAAIKRMNDDLSVRPYQTFTFVRPANAPFFIPLKLAILGWDQGPRFDFTQEFPMDFFAVKLTGAAFNMDDTFAPCNFIPGVADPAMSVLQFTKTAQLDSEREAFRNIFGTAEFPTTLKPNAQYKQGDTAKIEVINNGPKDLQVFMSMIGYAPKPGTIRRGDIQRGRVKPEQFDPQPMIGGRVR